MAYPSTIAVLTNPLGTDKLSTTPHSTIETNQNTEVVAIETFVGTLNSVVGSLTYDIRAAASNGGGHVQSANKGGTGQTSFNKGDLLVASSSSVLGKLGVGSDTQVLTADSTQTGGMKWGGVATAANIQQQTYTYARGSVMSASVYGINLSQAVSVLSDGQAFAVKFPTANTTSVLALSVNATGPSSVAARIQLPNGNNLAVGAIQASMIGLVEFDSVSSIFQLINPYIPVNFKVGTSSLAGTASSGNLVIPHGLSAVPAVVRISALKALGTQANFSNSYGVYNGVTSNAVYQWAAPSGSVLGTSNTTTDMVHIAENGADNIKQAATISVDSTNITLAFVKTGNPDANNINLLWEAQG